ncbi:MATE family efflux transporter [Chondromyces apiculatus]|uniref:MATE family efflux transporter n=1 Tax=Chondromyces apiculatus TaxID=51 RepID=UPI0018CC373F|nr:MATE family efflux transporter [Chondromyces apiculatus]
MADDGGKRKPSLLTTRRDGPQAVIPTGDVVRQVWVLAWPAMTHMLLLTLVFLVNRAMVGRYAVTALAATQICTSIAWSIISVFGASSSGTLAVVARAVGAGDRALAAAAARASLVFAAGLGVVVAVVMLSAEGALLRLLFPRAGAEVLAQADGYLRIVLPVLPLAFMEAVAAAALQGAGDTRTPLLAAVLGNLVNVALSAWLIFGGLGVPALGLRGAAVGAAATMAIEGLLLTAALMARSSPLPLLTRGGDALGEGFRPALGRVLRVALPAFAERLTYQAGYVGFVAMIGLLGAAAMAANQALVSIEGICFFSADGFGVAAAALVAQKLGAGQLSEAARTGRTAAWMAVCLLSAFGVVFALVPRLLMVAFSSEPEIVALGARSLYVAALAQPFMAFAMVTSMALRGAGATRQVLVVTLLSSFAVRLAATWVFAIELDLGLVGVWMGSTADWVIRTALLAVIWARGRWREVSV